MSKILAVVTSMHLLPGGTPTGFWLEELSTPYWHFTDAGYDVVIASPRGGPVRPDPASEAEDFIADSGRRLNADPVAQAKLGDTIALNVVDASDYVAILLVGGVGAAFDFDSNRELDRLLDEMIRGDKVVSAICHGTIGLSTVAREDGTAHADGQQMTGFSRAEEELLDLLRFVPVVPEERLRAVGARYVSNAEPFGPCVAEGPLFLTGQNPASAAGLAGVVLDRLRR